MFKQSELLNLFLDIQVTFRSHSIQGSVKYSGSPGNIKDIELDPELKDKNSAVRKNIATTKNNSTQNDNETCSNDFDEDEDLEEYTKVANWDLFRTYLNFGVSPCYLAGLLVMIVLAQVFISGSDYWVGYWANVQDQRVVHQNRTYEGFLFDWHILDEHGLMKENILIYIYTFLIVFCIIFSIVEHLMLSSLATRASKRLHDSMFSNLLDSKMAFFQANPSGNIST